MSPVTTKSRNKGRTRDQRARRHQRRLISHRGHTMFKSARGRARERGLPFELDRDDIQGRVDAGVCEMSGLPFDLAAPPRAWNTPSIDQIVPGAGYTRANTRVILFALNSMLNTWGPERVIEIADALKARAKIVAFGA